MDTVRLADPHVAMARSLILRLAGVRPDPAVREALAGLDAIDAELAIAREHDARLGGLAEVLLAMAALDFEKRAEIRDDDSPADRIARSINLLSEQLGAKLDEIRSAAAALRRSEDQVRQAQKMEAVGRLAGGIAHDFNNLLSVILSYTSLAIEGLQPDDPLVHDLGEIKAAAERAAALTSRLLAFSRQQVMAPVTLDVGALLDDAARMVARLLPATIALEIVHEATPLCVRGDRGQLEQVLVSLVVNARDAMPDGGRLRIEAAAEGPDRAVITVTDTGVGMDEATLARIFEPFFTTKAVGQGSGLGLSTAFGIIRQHLGTLSARSQPGRGTTLEVRLPRVNDLPTPVARRSTSGRSYPGTETILLCDDDDALRRVSLNVLRGRGYTVLEARDGVDALERYGARDDVHLLLTDLVMPRMTGRELAERMRASHPEMQVLYMSGYTADEGVRRGVAGGAQAFLQKPFTPNGLAQKVREVLDS